MEFKGCFDCVFAKEVPGSGFYGGEPPEPPEPAYFECSKLGVVLLVDEVGRGLAKDDFTCDEHVPEPPAASEPALTDEEFASWDADPGLW